MLKPSLSAGVYVVIATDDAGCDSGQAYQTLYEPPVVAASAVAIDPKCNKDATGLLQFSAIGGSGTGYQYSVLSILIRK